MIIIIFHWKLLSIVNHLKQFQESNSSWINFSRSIIFKKKQDLVLYFFSFFFPKGKKNKKKKENKRSRETKALISAALKGKSIPWNKGANTLRRPKPKSLLLREIKIERAVKDLRAQDLLQFR